MNAPYQDVTKYVPLSVFGFQLFKQFSQLNYGLIMIATVCRDTGFIQLPVRQIIFFQAKLPFLKVVFSRHINLMLIELEHGQVVQTKSRGVGVA
ncbi:MAG TPA: hypothetical protein VN223_05175, partial [Candidatus Elarobacter sp.]|nr:hypothetical protein [Candidatus Elarobacter sp.]